MVFRFSVFALFVSENRLGRTFRQDAAFCKKRKACISWETVYTFSGTKSPNLVEDGKTKPGIPACFIGIIYMEGFSLEQLKIKNLLDLTHTAAAPLLRRFEYPWQVLEWITPFILELGETLSAEEFDHPAKDVWISKKAQVAPTAYIGGPAIIGAGTEVRHGAFIRGSALVGENCVVGNSTELKNVILFDNVQVPHYNYVGDSILGYRSHMGAGSITSNVKSNKSLVTVSVGSEKIAVGRKKMGAVLGDGVEVGCNSVMNPGTVIGRGSQVYPLSMVRGFVPGNSIYKKAGEVAEKR